MASITNLTTQYPNGLIGVDDDPVRLSWQIDAPSSRAQTAAHIQVSRDAEFADVARRRGSCRAPTSWRSSLRATP